VGEGDAAPVASGTITLGAKGVGEPFGAGTLPARLLLTMVLSRPGTNPLPLPLLLLTTVPALSGMAAGTISPPLLSAPCATSPLALASEMGIGLVDAAIAAAAGCLAARPAAVVADGFGATTFDTPLHPPTNTVSSTQMIDLCKSIFLDCLVPLQLPGFGSEVLIFSSGYAKRATFPWHPLARYRPTHDQQSAG
jgi:hypothetical protein